MDILVAGGTGFIGMHVCRALEARDHEVYALAREPEEAMVPDGVEAVRGDVTRPSTLEEPVGAVDVVINLVALSPLYRPRGGRTHESVHLGGTTNLLASASETDLDRFVQISAVGADANGPTAYLRAKGAAEDAVKSTDVESTIIRPSVVFGDGGEFFSFIESVTTPYVTGLPGGGKTRFQPIWVSDIAPMIADAATKDEHGGKIYTLGGPRVYTLAELTKLLYRSKGTGVSILPIPMVLASVGMSVGGTIPGFPFGADQARSLKLDLIARENDIEAFGISSDDLRTIEDYLEVEAV